VLPFSRDEFFAVFTSYNTAVWPAQVFLYGLAAALVVLALRGRPVHHRAISLGLGLLWAWTGIVYHWWHFTAINRPAWGFGTLFVVQGALFVGHGIGGRRFEIGRPRGWHGWIGALLVTYALVVYPLLGLASGHPAREVPVLGVPCPTTIFTFGLLFWAALPIPRHLLVIPLVWAFIGSTAVFLLGVLQDVGLLVAGLLGLLLLRRAAPAVRAVPARRGGP
jgi:hypothetical protein